jgi:CelD/BcsL family acetyltransferase involved in cellulose biosynthesis
VFLRRNGTVVYKYGASDAGTWDLRPNHALFWTAIQEACENGDAVFDWGRTDLDNHGLRSFKKSWGAAEVPLTYTVFGGKAPSEPAATSGLPARAAAAAIRQAPPWLCRWTGEALYRFIA